MCVLSMRAYVARAVNPEGSPNVYVASWPGSSSVCAESGAFGVEYILLYPFLPVAGVSQRRKNGCICSLAVSDAAEGVANIGSVCAILLFCMGVCGNGSVKSDGVPSGDVVCVNRLSCEGVAELKNGWCASVSTGNGDTNIRRSCVPCCVCGVEVSPATGKTKFVLGPMLILVELLEKLSVLGVFVLFEIVSGSTELPKSGVASANSCCVLSSA